MKRLTFDEIIEQIRESGWLSDHEINLFIKFATLNRFKQRWTAAVNEKYKSLGLDAFKHDVICAMVADFISCFIDWALSSDDNWEYINTQWQEYWKIHR